MELTANGIILYHIVKKSSYSIQLFRILFPIHFLNATVLKINWEWKSLSCLWSKQQNCNLWRWWRLLLCSLSRPNYSSTAALGIVTLLASLLRRSSSDISTAFSTLQQCTFWNCLEATYRVTDVVLVCPSASTLWWYLLSPCPNPNWSARWLSDCVPVSARTADTAPLSSRISDLGSRPRARTLRQHCRTLPATRPRRGNTRAEADCLMPIIAPLMFKV